MTAGHRSSPPFRRGPSPLPSRVLGFRVLGFRALCFMVLAMTPAACGAQENPTLAGADDAFREGHYEDAARAYRRLLGSANGAARAGLAEVLVRTGEYEDAEEVARGTDGAAGQQRWLGEALLAQGRLDDADAAFAAAVDAREPGWLTAELRRGELEFRRGDADDALARFDRFIDVYNGGESLSTADLLAVGTAVKYLGTRNTELFYDAQKAYDEAAAADTEDPEPLVALGTLYLEKYQAGDATTHFTQALALDSNHPAARLGLARTMRFNNQPGVSEELDKALESNPNYLPAIVFSAQSRIEAEDLEGARDLVDRALAIDPVSLEARTVLAATHYLAGEDSDFRRIEAEVLADNPRYGAFSAEIADLAAQHRLYREAAELAAEGVERDPWDTRVQGILGLNQLRIGQIEEGRRNLDEAFSRDPFNVWFFNTLELLDSFENFEVVPTDNFEMVLDRRESDLLSVYIGHIAEEALSTMTERYGYTPPVPIRLEVFPNHADFSVRTVGLVGMGALGVSFGSVLAMDSPSAREAGSFNWASTLWHEVAHSFHLGLSGHRVPRWFTEGLSVWEQRRYRPGWGHGVTPGFVSAFRDGRLNSASELNEGFVRPAFPEQVVFSYYQASVLLEMIEERHGFRAILGFLEGYENGHTTAELISSVLGQDPGDLDRDFDRYLRDLLAAPLASTTDVPLGTPTEALASENPNNFFAQLKSGIERVQAEDPDGAEPFLRRAIELYPEYGGLDSPYFHLARIERDRGNLGAAVALLEQLMTVSESHGPGAQELAEAYGELGDDDGAGRAYERVIEIAPFGPEPHVALAAAYERSGRWSDAAIERAALVALAPVDRAGALYELGRVLHEAGRDEEARSAVLEALEIAPGFEEALELLLELRGTGGEE